MAFEAACHAHFGRTITTVAIQMARSALAGGE